jgi:serine/threonine protein kinase
MSTKEHLPAQPTSVNEMTDTDPGLESRNPATAWLGTLLKDRYEVEKLLGRGGVGVVYLAHDRQLMGKSVVIKVMLAEMNDSEHRQWFRRKFQQEIEALARIDHPGVVGVLDAGEMPDGRPYLVTQYVHGNNLRSIISDDGVPFQRVARIMKQAGHALSAAHEKGVFHRDIKPENIMLQHLSDGEEIVKLIDFGIATVRDSRVPGDTQITKAAGTLPYMSPEQLRGRPTALSDIYALGVVAFELLTGRHPYSATLPVELIEQQKEGIPLRPKVLRPDLPDAAEAVILKAMSYEASQRFHYAREFGDLLALALEGHKIELDSRGQTTRTLSDKANLPDIEELKKAASSYETDSGNWQNAQTAISDKKSDFVTSPIVRHLLPPGSRNVETRIETTFAVPDRRRLAVMGLLAALLVAVISGLMWWRKSDTKQIVVVEPTPALVQAERDLTYWISIEQLRGQKLRQPLRMAHEVLFGQDDEFRLFVSSPQSGYLYIINESPEKQGELPRYNILFPNPQSNAGLSRLSENDQVKIPEQSLFRLDQRTGTETLWLIWSEQSLPQLEELKKLVNASDRGRITNPEQIKALADLLRKYETVKSATQTDSEKKFTRVRATGAIIAHRILLEHHS